MTPAEYNRILARGKLERDLAAGSDHIWRADQPRPKPKAKVELVLYSQPPPSVGPFPNVGDLLPAFCPPVQPALLGFSG